MGDDFLWQRIAVSLSGVIYWGGVLVQARRVRKMIGRTPNLKPRGVEERLLWVGWTLVILGWILQPVWLWERPSATVSFPVAWVAGLVVIVGGYVATLWCYRTMGAAWRIGIDKQGTSKLVNTGPYRRIRHPIYAFQMMMLAGAVLLLPTWTSLGILLLHYVCASIKAAQEEKYLESIFGEEYREHTRRTWRFQPKP